MNRFVMKAHDLFRLQGKHRVGAPLILTELDFIHSRRPAFHKGPAVAADEAVVLQIFPLGGNRV